jgi:hypothetical protein
MTIRRWTLEKLDKLEKLADCRDEGKSVATVLSTPKRGECVIPSGLVITARDRGAVANCGAAHERGPGSRLEIGITDRSPENHFSGHFA